MNLITVTCQSGSPTHQVLIFHRQGQMREAIAILCATVAFLPVISAQTTPDPVYVHVL